MVITFQNGAFLAKSSYEEKDLLKQAGFWWHGKPAQCQEKGKDECWGCKAKVPPYCWWTNDPIKASMLVKYADEGAAAKLKDQVAAVEQSHAADADISLPCPAGLSYLGYQKAGIRYAMSKTKVLLADEMGLGKTVQALGVINTDPHMRRILVICPNTLKLNWRNETKKWLISQRPVIVVDPKDDTEVEGTKQADVVVIANYEKIQERKSKAQKEAEAKLSGAQKKQDQLAQVLKVEPVSQAFWPDWKAKMYTAAQTEMGQCLATIAEAQKELALANQAAAKVSFLGKLVAQHWDLLVIDEAHMIKNPKALRSLAVLGRGGKEPVKGLFETAGRSMFLTGTPLLNKPAELFPLLSKLAPVEFGQWGRFMKRYCEAKQTEYGWDVSGASNLAELQQRLRATCMIRRLKSEVLTELPPKTRQVVELEQNGLAKLVAKEAALWSKHEAALAARKAAVEAAKASKDEVAYKKAVSELKDEVSASFSEMSKVRHELALGKVPKVLEHVDNMLESEGKIVLFAHHQDVIEAIAQHYGAAAVVVYGPTKVEDRQAAVEKFQKDPSVRIFIGSIAAASVGITLTAASRVVFAELDWVPANITQAEDRCHRIGQIWNVFVQHLVVDGSLDARMAKTLVEKQEIADKALDRAWSGEHEPALPAAAA